MCVPRGRGGHRVFKVRTGQLQRFLDDGAVNRSDIEYPEDRGEYSRCLGGAALLSDQAVNGRYGMGRH